MKNFEKIKFNSIYPLKHLKMKMRNPYNLRSLQKNLRNLLIGIIGIGVILGTNMKMRNLQRLSIFTARTNQRNQLKNLRILTLGIIMGTILNLRNCVIRVILGANLRILTPGPGVILGTNLMNLLKNLRNLRILKGI